MFLLKKIAKIATINLYIIKYKKIEILIITNVLYIKI